MQTLSVVIATRNSVDRLQGTVDPWKAIAQEILIADQKSEDGTVELARKMGCLVHDAGLDEKNFDVNRKKAMLSAKSDWILYIDTDERPSTALIAEIQNILINPIEADGVKIPNEFYFLGKKLRYGLYSKRSAEIRLFRNGKWAYDCEGGFHRGVSVRGAVITTQNSYSHFNVNSLAEWFIKTNQYTELDAEKTWQLKKLSILKSVLQFNRFFIRHYFFKLGFLDGTAGFLSIVYFGFYHFTLDAKCWEKRYLNTKKENVDYLKPMQIPER